MRNGIFFTVSSRDRQRLQAIVADPKSPQKHVWRARIVLLSGEGLGTSAIMAETGKSKTCVWRWQERFMHEGVDGLLRDRTRPPGKAPIAPERVAEIVRLTQEPPPVEATHWTLRAMAKVAGVIGQNMQRHRHQEFIRFLNRIAREAPADKEIHVILDNYAAHKKDKVQAWLARHPHWTFHFTPTSCSWLNAVEGFFAKLTRRRLKHGVFHSVVDLQAAINRFVREYNAEKPAAIRLESRSR